eukprot:9826100-Ditylum_brightwellii.AAC.1
MEKNLAWSKKLLQNKPVLQGKLYSRPLNMSAVDSNMSSIAMKTCDAAGWKLDYVTKWNGRSLRLWFPDGNKVPLEYDATKYKLFVMCRHPTAYELSTIPIHWVDFHIEYLEMDDGTKLVRKENWMLEASIINPSGVVEEPEMKSTKITQDVDKQKEDVASILASTQAGTAQEAKNLNKTTPDTAMDIDWKQTLGHCTDETLAKTLVHTTQYFSDQIDAENQAYPTQHCQKQLFPLHYKRLIWRTSADTFFSSIKSIYVYTCDQ